MKKQIRSLVAITLALMFAVVGMVPSFAATELPAVCPGATATHTPDNCTYSTEVVPATCQEFGYTLCTCDVCGAKFVTDVTEKDTTDGHVWLTVQEYKSVPCSGTALPTVQKCAYCEVERVLDADGEVIGGYTRTPDATAKVGYVWTIVQTPTHTWTVPVTSCEVKVTTCADCGATKATTGVHNYKVTYATGTATIACTKCGAAPEELGGFEIVVPCDHKYTYVPMTRTCGYGFTLAHYECSLCDCWFFPAECEWYDDDLYVYITDTDTCPSFVAVDPALFTLTMTDYHACDYDDLVWTDCCTGTTAVCPACRETIALEWAVEKHEFSPLPSCCGYLFVCSKCGLEVEEIIDAETLEKWANEIVTYDLKQLYGLCTWSQLLAKQMKNNAPVLMSAYVASESLPITLNFDPDIARYFAYYLATNNVRVKDLIPDIIIIDSLLFDNYVYGVDDVYEAIDFVENTLGADAMESYRQNMIYAIVDVVIDKPLMGHNMVATETHYLVTATSAGLTTVQSTFGDDLAIVDVVGTRQVVTGTLVITADNADSYENYPLSPGCLRACETWYYCKNCAKTSYAKRDGTEGHATATAVFEYGKAGTVTIEYCTNPWCTSNIGYAVDFGGVRYAFVGGLDFSKNAPVLKYQASETAKVVEYNVLSETFTNLLVATFGPGVLNVYDTDELSRYKVAAPIISECWTINDNDEIEPLVVPEFALGYGAFYCIINAKLEFPGMTTETIVGEDALKAELNRGIYGGEWFNAECSVHSLSYDSVNGILHCEYCTFDVKTYEVHDCDFDFNSVTIYEYKITPTDRIVVTHGEILAGGVTSSMVETTFVYYDGSRETTSGNVATSSKVIMSIVPIEDASAVEVASTTVMSHVWDCNTSDTPERLVVWNGSELISVTGITGIPVKSEYTREEYVKYHGDVVNTRVISEQGGYSIEEWRCADCGTTVRVKTPLYNGHVLPISLPSFLKNTVDSGLVDDALIILDAADFEAQLATFFAAVVSEGSSYNVIPYDGHAYIASSYCQDAYYVSFSSLPTEYKCTGCGQIYGYDRALNFYTKEEWENKEATSGAAHYWLVEEDDIIYENCYYDYYYALFVKHAVCSNCGLEVNYGYIDVYYTDDDVIFRDCVTGSDLGLNIWELERCYTIGRYDFPYDDEYDIKCDNLVYVNWVDANDHPFWYKDLASQTTFVVAPTCTEEGIKLYFCECCDTWYGGKIEKLAHSVVEGDSLEPTCTEPGYTAEFSCTECGEILTASEVIPAFGYHTTIYDQTFTSYPCTEQGKVDIFCKFCGYVPEVITHNFNRVTEAATCGFEGFVYDKCADCGFIVYIDTIDAYYADHRDGWARATTTVIVDGVEYLLTPETWSSDGWHHLVEATAQKDDFWVRYCTICGFVETDSDFNYAEFSITYTNLVGEDNTIADSDTFRATVSLDTKESIWGMQFVVKFSDNLKVVDYEFVNEFADCEAYYANNGHWYLKVTINNWNALEGVGVDGPVDIITIDIKANKMNVFAANASLAIGAGDAYIVDAEGNNCDAYIQGASIGFAIETLGEVDGRTLMDHPNLADVNAILHILAGDYEVDGKLVTYMATADIDKDGEITEADAAALLRYVTGADTYEILKATV